MPLSAAYPTLISDIEAAFKKKQEAYEKSDASKKMSQADRDAIDTQFYTALATAIHAYTMSAVVATSVGCTVIGMAAPLAPAGAAPVFGTAVGTGAGNLI
jgi:hypothetical protein